MKHAFGKLLKTTAVVAALFTLAYLSLAPQALVYSQPASLPPPGPVVSAGGTLRVLGAPFSFGDVPVGSYQDVDFLVINTGMPWVSVTVLNVALSNKDDFAIIRPRSFPRTLAPGQVLVVTARFKPTSEESKTTAVIIRSTAAIPVLLFTLGGDGTSSTPPAATPTAWPTEMPPQVPTPTITPTRVQIWVPTEMPIPTPPPTSTPVNK